jgi:hypothetical protein
VESNRSFFTKAGITRDLKAATGASWVVLDHSSLFRRDRWIAFCTDLSTGWKSLPKERAEIVDYARTLASLMNLNWKVALAVVIAAPAGMRYGVDEQGRPVIGRTGTGYSKFQRLA